MAAKSLPSAEELRQLLRYEPETGRLFWNERHSGWSGFNALYADREAMIYTTSKGYKRGRLKGRLVLAHRVIWKIANGRDAIEIDHINGNRSDNRLCNLRSVDRSGNMRNMRISDKNSSGVLGVYRKRDAWVAAITVNKKFTSIGTFASKDAAIEARHAANKKHGYHPNHGRARDEG